MGAGGREPGGVAVRVSTEQSQLGEGIRWDARRSELLAVDIVAGRVYRGRVGDDGSVNRVQVYQLPGTVGMIAPLDGDDGWLLGAGRGFVYLALDGSHRSIAEVALAGTRMNDGACDPPGPVLGRDHWHRRPPPRRRRPLPAWCQRKRDRGDARGTDDL